MTSRPKKIFHVITRLNVGGAALFVLNLASELRTRGHAVTLITGVADPGEGEMLELRPDLATGFRILHWPRLRRSIKPLWDIQIFFRLCWLFLKERPDVVHTHLSKAGILARLAAFFTGVPAIVHSNHGNVFVYIKGKGTGLLVKLEKFFSAITHKILVTTPALKQELIDWKLANEAQVEVVPLGLNLTQFKDLSPHRGELRKELGLKKEILIGTAARLARQKDLETLISVAAQLVPDFPEVRFAIAGDGPLRQDLEDQARRLGVARHIYFLGFRSNMPAIYADLDIVVLSSRQEGACIVVLEALAASKPVVASAVGGIIDAIQHGDNGYLFQPGDIAGLGDILKGLLRDSAQRLKVAERAGRQAIEAYSVERVTSQIEGLYDSLLPKGSRRKQFIPQPA